MAIRSRTRAPVTAATICALALLASCAMPQKAPVPVPVPAPAPSPRPAPPPASAPLANWRDAPASVGNWRWRMEGALSVASYVSPDGQLLASLSCDKTRGSVVLSRDGSATGPTAITILATSGRFELAGQPGTDRIVVAISPASPILDAIAFSRGRFALEVQGAQPLYLPSWPELSRVIEDCR